MTATLAGARRVVVKIGSALLADEAGGLKRDWLAALAQDIGHLHAGGVEMLIVSSGAIAVGRRLLGLARGPRNRALRLEESQAAAATGQIHLAHAWHEALARHAVPVAQVLLTIENTENRRRYLNARSTMATLLRLHVVPVINENDTVATDEIRFGDNDRLAGRVAQMMEADACVLLTDVDGLHTADPNEDPGAPLVPEVHAITPEIEAMAAKPRTADGSGGMITKLDAARVAMAAGCRLAIANGRDLHPLAALNDGKSCTWFVPAAEPRTARKRWIAGSLMPVGGLVIDDGAARALAGGKSLLPAGITSVEGNFDRGDPVVVKAANGTELGRGLCAYSADDARRIAGHKSGEIEEILGYRGREEVIHRDDLALD